MCVIIAFSEGMKTASCCFTYLLDFTRALFGFVLFIVYIFAFTVKEIYY